MRGLLSHLIFFLLSLFVIFKWCLVKGVLVGQACFVSILALFTSRLYYINYRVNLGDNENDTVVRGLWRKSCGLFTWQFGNFWLYLIWL